MYDLSKVDLGRDEAEQDQRLREYFLKTSNYKNVLAGGKKIVVGRKGSGKSAIFTLMRGELEKSGALVIPITPDQYSWGALRDYQEQGILPVQAHTNAWKVTLLFSVLWKLNETGLVSKASKLVQYYRYMKDAYTIDKDDLFSNIVRQIRQILSGVKTPWLSVDFQKTDTVATPLKIARDMTALLQRDWPRDKQVRILIDRLDDSWDASEGSQQLLIGLLKAANDLNAAFADNIIVTVFLRSDIYDNLLFDDKDKLRQYEETLYWNDADLKAVVCERVRVSLGLGEPSNDAVWQNLFSPDAYRSRASAEKFILDRTFKRPRDIISFARFAIEVAVRNSHSVIETTDTRLAVEEKYSKSKYEDLIIEYQKQFPYIKDLLDSFSGSLHKLSQGELKHRLANFVDTKQVDASPDQILRQLFVWGVVGVKRQGRAGVQQRGGAHFFYYYDDPSINPLAFEDYYIHPSLRYYLTISEKRERIANPA